MHFGCWLPSHHRAGGRTKATIYYQRRIRIQSLGVLNYVHIYLYC